jgi:branched-chain amino acid transport system permease protein
MVPSNFGRTPLYVLVYVALLAMPSVLDDLYLRVALLAGTSAIAVIGLNFVMGYAGLISLAQAVFVGVGAYTMALMSVRGGLNPWFGIMMAPVTAGLVGWCLGWPLLRLRGHYLALATLGMSVTAGIVAVNWREETGGDDGIGGIPNLSFFGVRLETDHQLYCLIWAILGVSIIIAALIRRSHLGMAMIITRDDEIAASTSGINVPRVRLVAFTLGAAFAGIAGALTTQLQGYISPSDFDFTHSVQYLAMLVVGGEGSIVGAVLGAIILTILPELLRFLGQGYLILFGFGIVVILLVLPKGVVSLPHVKALAWMKPARDGRA